MAQLAAAVRAAAGAAAFDMFDIGTATSRRRGRTPAGRGTGGRTSTATAAAATTTTTPRNAAEYKRGVYLCAGPQKNGFCFAKYSPYLPARPVRDGPDRSLNHRRRMDDQSLTARKIH